jgi:predicted histidine transporter YuiF (NhaC family)
MMSEEEYRRKRKTSTKAFLPAVGLILLIAFGAISYAIAPILERQFRGKIGAIPDGDMGELFYGAMLFLILIMITGLVLAFFSPKSKKNVSERELDKERKMKHAETVAKKKRYEQAKVKMAQERRQAAQESQKKK